MNNHYYWKCRCMGNDNFHKGGVWLMSGTWKVHMNLSHTIYPYGLHRIFYRLKYNDLDNLFEDDGFEKVVYRSSNKLYRL